MKCNDCKATRGVQLCQGDLQLCNRCKIKRFPSETASAVDPGHAGHDEDNILTILKEIRSINEKLKKIDILEAHLQQVDKSMSFINAMYEENKKDMEEIKAVNRALIEDNEKLKTSISNLESSYDDLDQYIRRENIEIRGIPELPNENTDSISLKVVQLIAKDVTGADIDVSHRIKKRQPPGNERTNTRFPPSIIVRFTSRKVRDSVYKQRKNLSWFKTSDLGYEVENDIFTNDNLTP
ncbi:uncharacterized protein [Ptychodera flava]|uniref:uncharacterized protein n=1 Tax=Ptychodera flava TaxID=63121 RepID=UPI003969F1E4